MIAIYDDMQSCHHVIMGSIPENAHAHKMYMHYKAQFCTISVRVGLGVG